MASLRSPGNTVPRNFLIAVGFACVMLADPATADANDGEFMGYKLNQQYPMTARTQSGPSFSGNLVLVAENAVTPADIGEVRLTTTVESHTIGFIEASQSFSTDAEARAFAKKYYELLHAKYPDWRIDAGRIELNEKTLMPTALNMDKWPYTIRMKTEQTDATDWRPFRVSLTLRYLFDSPERQAWNQLAIDEQGQRQDLSKEQMLEKADTRGL